MSDSDDPFSSQYQVRQPATSNSLSESSRHVISLNNSLPLSPIYISDNDDAQEDSQGEGEGNRDEAEEVESDRDNTIVRHDDLVDVTDLADRRQILYLHSMFPTAPLLVCKCVFNRERRQGRALEDAYGTMKLRFKPVKEYDWKGVRSREDEEETIVVDDINEPDPSAEARPETPPPKRAPRRPASQITKSPIINRTRPQAALAIRTSPLQPRYAQRDRKKPKMLLYQIEVEEATKRAQKWG